MIFCAIAVAWLLYIVPSVLRSRDDSRAAEAPAETGQAFGPGIRQLRHLDDDDAIDEDLEVSTPLTRKLQIRRLNRLAARAAQRRRHVLLMLLGTAVALTVTSALHQTPWWSLGIVAVGFVLFTVVGRWRMRRQQAIMDRIADDVIFGDDEPTVCLDLRAESERVVELTGPIEFSGSLWDPVPVTAPTYVQKPLAPRTVRTIDLSAPSVPQRSVPPTADRPVDVEAARVELVPDDVEVTEEIVLPRAVGE